MRAFSCTVCRRLAPFESNRCLNCGADHGFDWTSRELIALRALDSGWLLETVATGEQRQRCANLDRAECNGLAEAHHLLCRCCRLTRTRPDDDDHTALAQFAQVEAAKRRLVFELLELGLAVDEGALAFDLLSSHLSSVTTGHADGVITLDVAEADDAHRTAVRLQMREPYRTLLGHLRHEIGHYYQPRIVPEEALDEMRSLFGDERTDYQDALDRHYRAGGPLDWDQHAVSAYATVHPWEDWAETFAHYLHIRDTLQTAGAFGVELHGPPVIETSDDPPPTFTPWHQESAEPTALITRWLPLAHSLNALARSMGEHDLYPFVISPPAARKLGFIHRMVTAAR